MPQPSTVGGGLMGYPTSVDSGPTQPWFIGEIGDLANCTANTRTANGCYFQQILVRDNVVLTGFRYQFGTGGNGNCQLGIYDANGNLLAASAVAATATGVMTFNLSSSLALSPGRYSFGFWISNATDTTFSISATNASALPASSGTNAGGLPTTIAATTGLAPFFRRLSILGLIQGGWS